VFVFIHWGVYTHWEALGERRCGRWQITGGNACNVNK